MIIILSKIVHATDNFVYNMNKNQNYKAHSASKKKSDYVNAPEYIDYCKEKMPVLKKKLPKMYVRPIQEILKSNGFDYSDSYVRDCLRPERAIWNIYVTKAAEEYVSKNVPDPDNIFLHLPDESPVRKLRAKRPLANRLGLAKR